MSLRSIVALVVVTLAGAACGATSDVRRTVAARNAALVAGSGQVAAGAAGSALPANGSPGGDGLPASESSVDRRSPVAPERPAPRRSPAVRPPGVPGPTTGGASTVITGPPAPGSSGSGSGPAAAGSGTGTASAPARPGGNGGATDVGVTADTIKLGGIFFNGSWLDRYVQVAEQAARAYFRYVNDQGGIYGRKIDYISCDTAATADGTQSCARKLGDGDKVFALGPSMDV